MTDRKKPRRGKSTFLLAEDVRAKLKETALRLEQPQSRILEALVRKYADGLQIRVE